MKMIINNKFESGGPSLGQKLRILNAAGLRAWTDAKATGVGPVLRTLHRSMAVPLSSSKSSKFLREFYFIILNNL
jgi:hypothetical protein